MTKQSFTHLHIGAFSSAHLLICNYFISGTTSGVMEGINNKIKLIMRLGYGLTNFDNLRSRLLGCCS
jgi:transposase